MTNSELQGFRGLLTARIAELERLTRQRDRIAVVRSADVLEEIQAASERALAITNLDLEYGQLLAARAALRRIQAGTFGTCEHCDEDIHPRRLLAVPWAPLCIRCQELADRRAEKIPQSTGDFGVRAA